MGDGGDATVAYGRRLRRPELRRILRRPEVRLRVAAGFRAIGGEQPCGVTASRAEVTRGDDALAPIQDEQPPQRRPPLRTYSGNRQTHGLADVWHDDHRRRCGVR